MDPKSLFPTIPSALRDPLFNEYDKILKNFRERRWEPAGLNGGKFAEVVFSILKGYIDNSFSAKPYKPKNMVDECRNLENTGSQFNKSIRVHIPRVLVALYEIRNNRGIGHVGGDVDPNFMDARIVISMAKWALAELIRIFHNVTVDQAQNIVDSITSKESELVWEVDGIKRVLRTTLPKTNQALILLHSCNGSVSENDLFTWIEHSNKSVFRRDILSTLHKKRFIEFNKKSGKVQISPTGISFVEENLLEK